MAVLDSLDTKSVLVSGFAAIFIYLAVVALYRITLHPLAKIPGPKLAAITQLYQTYYSYHNGQSRFYKQIELLHKKYGPVVRITPNEVSLSDPDNYAKIYNVGTKYWKAPEFYSAFGAPAAAFCTPSNELHRVRRAALNPMFSRKVVLDLEDVVQEKALKLATRLEKTLDAGTPGGLDIHHGFRAVSVDVISDYAFNDCYDLLERDDFGLKFFAMVKGTIGAFWVFMQSPTIQAILLNMPPWMVLNPSVKLFNEFLGGTKKNIEIVKARIEAGEDKSSRPSIFKSLLDPNVTEGHVVPSLDELVDDAFILIAAASDTTGNAMTIATYHVLNNPEIYSTLKDELRKAFPDGGAKLDFLTLEKLPYLTAVVKEGLRLSFGVVGRLPRVVPEPGAVFNGYSIPAGYVVGMSSWIIHLNPSIFPDPYKFDPTRWLKVEDAQYLSQYLVAFSKGSRQCIGMPLAYCELYVTLGTIFRRFESLQIHGVTPEDLVLDDFFSSYHPDDANKLHVINGPA